MTRKVLAEFDAVEGPFLAKMRAIDASIGRFETGALTAFGRVEKGIGSLTHTAMRLQMVGAAVGAGFGAQIVTSFLDRATRVRTALRSIGEDSDQNFQMLYLASTRAIAPMDVFAAAVQRMHKAMADKQSFQETVRQVETLSKLMAVSGKTAEERSAAMLQFSQALQSGRLQGDEFRSLRENAPIELLQAIADQLGTTRASLQKFATEGKITSDVMIAALTTLESEADSKIKAVVLTFSDAATLMMNGAMMAGAAFDKGAGITRAGTAALKDVGEILASNTEAFEMFGKAAQIAFAFLGAAYLGRRAAEATAALQRFYTAQTVGVQAAYDGAVKLQAAEAATVAAKEKSLLASRAKVQALTLEGAAQTRITAAQRAAASAEASLTAARVRFTAATNAATVAQERLVLSSRATVAAGNLMRAAFSFMGGWPGLLLTVGIAFATMQSKAEELASSLARVDEASAAIKGLAQQHATATEAIVSDTAQLQQVYADLAKAILGGGEAAGRAKDMEIVALSERISKNKVLLGIIAAQMKLEAEKERAAIEASRIELTRNLGTVHMRNQAASAFDRGGRPGVDAFQDDLGRSIQRKIEANKELTQAETDFFMAWADIRQKEDKLADDEKTANDALALSRIKLAASLGHGARAEAQDAPEVAVTEEMNKQVAKYQELLAAIREGTAEKIRQAALDATIAIYGERSAEAVQMRAQIARAAYGDELAALVQSKEVSQQQAAALQEAYDAANGVAGVDMATGIWAAFDAASALAGKLWEAMRAKAAAAQDNPIITGSGAMIRPSSLYGNMGGRGIPADAGGQVASAVAGAVDTGGGGVGQSQTDDDRQKALQFIEQMMTAEEQQAKKLQEVLDLRSRLIATYGPEDAQVKQLDVSIARLQDGLQDADTLQKQLFDNIGNSIVASMNDWKGWGNLVRSILANLAQSYGVDFFTSLLTPGKQTGGGLGNLLGNIVTGDVSIKAAKTISESSMALALPSARTAGETVTIVQNNDFSNADPTMRAHIEAKLAKLKRDIPGTVIDTMRKARKQRIPV